MERLEDESIVAECVQDQSIGDIYIGGPPPMSIWLNDAADTDRAMAILNELYVQRSRTKCRACGYDLQGHKGATACPECGVAQTAPQADRECPACHQPVPGNFEVCWSCGADMVR